MISSPYLYDCLDTKRLKRIVAQAVKDLSPYKKRFDGIAFKGVSGALVAPAIAVALNKKLILVRDSRKTHSWRIVEGSRDIKRYIIVDDFVESGKTVRFIIKRVKEFSPKAIAVGRYLYTPANKQLQIWNPETKELLTLSINCNHTLQNAKGMV